MGVKIELAVHDWSICAFTQARVRSWVHDVLLTSLVRAGDQWGQRLQFRAHDLRLHKFAICFKSPPMSTVMLWMSKLKSCLQVPNVTKCQTRPVQRTRISPESSAQELIKSTTLTMVTLRLAQRIAQTAT